MTNNPYQAPNSKKQDSSAGRARCGASSRVKRDRVLVAVIASFGLLGMSVFLFRETIEQHFSSMEIAYSIVGNGFIASVVGILFIFRPISTEPTLPTKHHDRYEDTDPAVQEQSAGKRKVNFHVSCLLAAFCIPSFALGFWILDPRSAEEGTLYLYWLLASVFLGFLGAFLIHDRLTKKVSRTLTIANASVASVVMARVVWDEFTDSSSHNLWPFEVGFACF